MRMTTKQTKILGCLCDKNADGSEVDLDQLLEALRAEYHWETTKPSLQFSLRRLIEGGLVTKLNRQIRRGRLRAILTITPLGLRMMGRL